VWSRGCERLYGWTAEQAIGRRAHELLQTSFPVSLSAVEDALLSEGEWHGDLRHRTREGDQIIVVAHEALRRDASGNPAAVLVNVVDITHQRDIEARLAQSQKMEAVGQLTGGFAHDFNNLLLAVGLSLEMIEDEEDIDEDSPLHPVLAGAKHATEQARILIAQLLAFGRRQALTPSPLDVNAAVISVTRMLRRTLAANITIDSVLAPELWIAFADGAQFETALLNLAINARDAMPSGGRLLIETVNQPLIGAFAQTFDVTPGDYVAVSVSDTGSGMSPEIAARAFEPFFTTKPAQQGTGLGLSQVYGFMKQTGGHVTLQSKTGQGTRLVLYLPRSHGPAVTASPPSTRGTAAGQGEVILIVEDNTVVREAVAHVLTGLGYRVKTATTGDEALTTLRGDTPIDLLFTDVVLPGGLLGDRLAFAARRLRPQLRILLTSGYSQSFAESGANGLEEMELIAKPYTTAELAERIRRALAAPQQILKEP
jgi:PAS domain S-box-containing protein